MELDKFNQARFHSTVIKLDWLEMELDKEETKEETNQARYAIVLELYIVLDKC